ncbi:glycosyltransferase [Rothia terrae]|uniref:Glycosyltransferase family 1 protein n=1 Tax=Rothia terrae TaxID=396015 RepID=A0A7H2BCF3_9MICC|nr:glycosyltransferase [Rothia terrae]QNV37349.1 glycosyltransferase family 1 protein [Rothia terrae]
MPRSQNNSVDIILAVPSDMGWAPIHVMTDLLAKYLNTTPIEVNISDSLKKTTKFFSLIPRVKTGNKSAIVIAYDPGQLYAVAQYPLLTRRYEKIVGWVIDSFWEERIPFIAKNNTYNHIFVMDDSDINGWKQRGVNNVSALPWGANVWSNFKQKIELIPDKKTDLLRVGRQPTAWEKDEETRKIARKYNLFFQGRPSFGSTFEENQSRLRESLSQSKYVLAFTSSVSPASYTHNFKDYLTARWTDALACGCIVVGKAPTSMSASKLLWNGATVDINPFCLEEGIKEICLLNERWDASQSKKNIRLALQRLDWRHRFYEIFQYLGIQSYALERDLQEMKQYEN